MILLAIYKYSTVALEQQPNSYLLYDSYFTLLYINALTLNTIFKIQQEGSVVPGLQYCLVFPGTNNITPLLFTTILGHHCPTDYCYTLQTFSHRDNKETIYLMQNMNQDADLKKVKYDTFVTSKCLVFQYCMVSWLDSTLNTKKCEYSKCGKLTGEKRQNVYHKRSVTIQDLMLSYLCLIIPCS